MRADGRMPDEIRPLTLERNYTRYAPGSVLARWGNTQVLCTAMVEPTVPRHCIAQHMGWVTAEYCMLPSASPERRSLHLWPDGRTSEIQRIIGRALRMSVDLHQIGERTIWIDCDVIQADGGTRTASITASFVALVDALWDLKEKKIIAAVPVKHPIGAVSVGIVEGLSMLDLSAAEDQHAAVDMNVVMTHAGEFVELQGTAEAEPFGPARLKELLDLAAKGMKGIKRAQSEALGDRLRT